VNRDPAAEPRPTARKKNPSACTFYVNLTRRADLEVLIRDRAGEETGAGERAVLFRSAQVLSIRIPCPIVLGKKTGSKSRPNRAQMVKKKIVESRKPQIKFWRKQIETQSGFILLLLHEACMLPVFFLFYKAAWMGLSII